MKIACPSCHAELDVGLCLQHEASRRAVARLAQISLPFGALTLRYMALFKPASRALSIDHMVRLVEELLPDIERQSIKRNGREWFAELETWRAAMNVVLGMSEQGRLQLPLRDHALLYQVMANMADKVESKSEASREADRRKRHEAGVREPGAVHVGGVATPPAVTVVQPHNPAPGPSRAALAIQAQIAASRQARMGASATDPATPESTKP